jgi:hypothetical protein
MWWAGILSIEAQLDDGALADPIYPFSASSKASRPMKFALDASTQACCAAKLQG